MKNRLIIGNYYRTLHNDKRFKLLALDDDIAWCKYDNNFTIELYSKCLIDYVSNEDLNLEIISEIIKISPTIEMVYKNLSEKFDLKRKV